MNKAEFGILIEHPENLGKSHVAALKNIIADFPYFQAPSVMLARALFNDNHYEFEKQLRATALIVPDREVLYSYINNIRTLEKSATLQETTLKNQEILTPAIIEEITVDEAFLRADTLNIIPETQEIQTPAIIEEVITPDTIPSEETPATEVKVPIIPVIEKEPAVTLESPPLPVQQVETTIHERNLGSASYSFSEWLALSNAHQIPVATPIKKDEDPNTDEIFSPLEDVLIPVNVTPVPIDIPALPETPENPDTKSNISQFDSILDKFISESPSISRPKAAFYNPANMAKQSVDLDEDLVTETLANVYFKQGHYKKAIRAYEKLCLIYPHKMAYFADLIQKIKKEIKD